MKPLRLFTIKQNSCNERHYSYGIDMHNDFRSLIVLPEVRIRRGRSVTTGVYGPDTVWF